jgi:hypothetical protein
MERRTTMSRIRAVASAMVVPAALAAVLSQGFGDAEAQRLRKVYSAKFLCGEFQTVGVCVTGPFGAPCQSNADCPSPGGPGICEFREGPVKPGNYQTAINIVNPTRKKVSFVKKAVLLFDMRRPPLPGQFEIPQPPGQKFKAVLEKGWGMEIDCPDIRQVLLGQQVPPGSGPLPFIKGFVEIEVFNAQHSLDVVPAYTTHGFDVVDPVCSAPGSAIDGLPCDPADPTDPCVIDPTATCLPGGRAPEGFSIDVEKVAATIP